MLPGLKMPYVKLDFESEKPCEHENAKKIEDTKKLYCPDCKKELPPPCNFYINPSVANARMADIEHYTNNGY